MFLDASAGHRSRRRALVTGAAAFTAAALVLAGCSNSSSKAGSTAGSAPTATNTLIAYTGQSGDYQINFNPYSPSSIGGIGSIYEPLFFVTNINNSAPVPLLGTKSTWNKEGTQLDITVRNGVKWSDGTPFTAKDVKFTFDMILANQSLNTSGFDGKVKATDDSHIVITWDHPAFMEGPNVLGRIYIVPQHIWKSVNPKTDVMQKPVGTGAFLMSNFKTQAFTLSANPSYWGGAPAVKAIRYLSLSGNTAGADALKAGTIDWQTGPVPDMAHVSKNYPGYNSITIPQNQVVLGTCSSVKLGCTGPQTDVNVRKAIYYALNRTQLNSLAFQNTNSDISPSFALLHSQSDTISPAITERTAPDSPNIAKSAALLEGAGWAKGSDGYYAKDGKKLSLSIEVVSGWTDYITAIDLMSQQLKAAGIKVVASQSSWNEWTDKKAKGNFQLAIDSLGQGPSNDPYYCYNNYFSTSNTANVGTAVSLNFGRFSDADVDKALKELERVNPSDTTTRNAQFAIIQKKIAENMAYIPVQTGGTTSEFHSAKFTGWPTLDSMYAFPAIWASPDNSQVFKKLVPTGK